MNYAAGRVRHSARVLSFYYECVTTDYLPVQKSVDTRQVAIEDATVDGQIDVINKTED